MKQPIIIYVGSILEVEPTQAEIQNLRDTVDKAFSQCEGDSRFCGFLDHNQSTDDVSPCFIGFEGPKDGEETLKLIAEKICKDEEEYFLIFVVNPKITHRLVYKLFHWKSDINAAASQLRENCLSDGSQISVSLPLEVDTALGLAFLCCQAGGAALVVADPGGEEDRSYIKQQFELMAEDKEECARAERLSFKVVTTHWLSHGHLGAMQLRRRVGKGRDRLSYEGLDHAGLTDSIWGSWCFSHTKETDYWVNREIADPKARSLLGRVAHYCFSSALEALGSRDMEGYKRANKKEKETISNTYLRGEEYSESLLKEAFDTQRRYQIRRALISALRVARGLAFETLEGTAFRCTIYISGSTSTTLPAMEHNPPLFFNYDYFKELKDFLETCQNSDLALIVDPFSGRVFGAGEIKSEGKKLWQLENSEDRHSAVRKYLQGMEGVLIKILPAGRVEVYSSKLGGSPLKHEQNHSGLRLVNEGMEWGLDPKDKLRKHLRGFFTKPGAEVPGCLFSTLSRLLEERLSSIVILLDKKDKELLDEVEVQGFSREKFSVIEKMRQRLESFRQDVPNVVEGDELPSLVDLFKKIHKNTPSKAVWEQLTAFNKFINDKSEDVKKEEAWGRCWEDLLKLRSLEAVLLNVEPMRGSVALGEEAKVESLSVSSLVSILRADGVHCIDQDGYINSIGLRVLSYADEEVDKDKEFHVGSGSGAARALTGIFRNSTAIKVSASGRFKYFYGADLSQADVGKGGEEDADGV